MARLGRANGISPAAIDCDGAVGLGAIVEDQKHITVVERFALVLHRTTHRASAAGATAASEQDNSQKSKPGSESHFQAPARKRKAELKCELRPIWLQKLPGIDSAVVDDFATVARADR